MCDASVNAAARAFSVLQWSQSITKYLIAIICWAGSVRLEYHAAGRLPSKPCQRSPAHWQPFAENHGREEMWPAPVSALLILLSQRVLRTSASNLGTPWKRAISATVDQSSTRMVADRHRQHCWRAFRGYQHRWPWTTLNPKIAVFSEFFAISGCDVL